MDTAALIVKRQAIVRKTPRIGHVMKGSIVIVKRYCGKPNCRCRQGFKHRSLYVSRTDKGISRLVYIPKRSEEDVRRLIGNYRKLKSALNTISRFNMQVMTAPRRDKALQ